MKPVALLVVAATLAASAGAAGGARIVPQKGIAGVRLGMTQAQVKERVGLPRRAERGRNEIGSYVTYRYRTYSVTFFGGPRVTGMETASPEERTDTGVGVGSTRAQVKSRVAGVKCLKEFGYDHCYVGNWKPGGVISDFALVRGRVTRISIGYVID